MFSLLSKRHQDFENANGDDAVVVGDSNKKGDRKVTATVLLISGLLVLIQLICIIYILQNGHELQWES